ncbi:hypothetical protein ACN47E_003523 [Coniothyrium glycines]
MPAMHHLQSRQISVGSSDAAGSISALSIGLIVGIGVVPTIIVIWVVIFLFFAYPNDRNWCCMKRKKRKDNMLDLDDDSTQIPSQETLHENTAYDIPKRPFVGQGRTESGNSSYAGRFTQDRPSMIHNRAETRMSLQSLGSASTVHGAQEPKPFV